MPDGFAVDRPSCSAACLLSSPAVACCRSLLPCRYTIAAREVKSGAYGAAGAPVTGLCAWGARPARARRIGKVPQSNPAHSGTARRGAIFLGSHCPARRHRVQAALRASLRDGFASPDPAPTHTDSAPTRKTGED